MDFINKLLFNFNSFISAKYGVWETIIMWFDGGIKNYVWAILVLTITIKLIMLPLDFINKKINRKNVRMQQKIQPELDVLKKKYGNDKNTLNQKTLELYKKHNYSLGGSCIITLVTLGLTLFIFITLFTGLNNMAKIKITEQYKNLEMAYYGVSNYEEITEASVPVENYQERVLEEYKNSKESWLWIENVWVADSPLSNPVLSFNGYAKLAKLSKEQKSDEVYKTRYETIMKVVNDNTKNENGYLILVIAIIGLSVAQQLLMNTSIRFKKKEKNINEPKKPKAPTNKIMLIILPLFMGYFAFMYNAVFAVYLMISSLMSVVTTPFINSAVDFFEKKSEAKEKEKNKVIYSRKK